ncbi:Proto-oncogene vav [Acipenser ruthenus]|uniref:Proto-oncogene vav n=1 Tax=Acipenser ruthenus TaxID=7906 RepID=A0A662YKG0_ACIRT|nr:Proto-oncogene vav [Acipenser ruthenus]
MSTPALELNPAGSPVLEAMEPSTPPSAQEADPNSAGSPALSPDSSSHDATLSVPACSPADSDNLSPDELELLAKLEEQNSLRFSLDGVVVQRLSACCESRHRHGRRLGGRTGHFGVVSVHGASPCPRFNVEIKHIKVTTSSGLFQINEKKAFKGLIELVEFYQRNTLKECFKALDTTLQFPFQEPEQQTVAKSPAGSVRYYGTARARYDFSARDRLELSMREGDVIKIISKKGQQGWWKGEIYGRSKNNRATVHRPNEPGLPKMEVSQEYYGMPPPPVAFGQPLRLALGDIIELTKAEVDQSWWERLPPDLTMYPWFAGNMERSGAENLLSSRSDGTYLVRQRQKDAGEYAISIKYAFLFDKAMLVCKKKTSECMELKETIELQHYQLRDDPSGDKKVRSLPECRVFFLRRYAFLFDKAMLVCKKKTSECMELKETIELQHYQLRDDPSGDKKWSHLFVLIDTYGQQSYDLYFKTKELKKKWLEQFEMAIILLRSCPQVQHVPGEQHSKQPRLPDELLRGNHVLQGLSDALEWSHLFVLIDTYGQQSYDLYFKTKELKKKWLEQFEMAMSNMYPENSTANSHDFQMNSFEETTSCKACQMLLRLLLYGAYCSQVESSSKHLDKVASLREDVRMKLEECSKRANNGRFTLRDLLMVPMQRVLKYHLLLQELVKHTTDATDKDNLRTALDAMRVIDALSSLSYTAIAQSRGVSDTGEEDDDLYDCVDDENNEGDEIYEDLMRHDAPAETQQKITEVDKRQCCLQEIRQTEEKYTETLGSILNHFMKPLQRFLQPSDIESIFINIECTIVKAKYSEAEKSYDK